MNLCLWFFNFGMCISFYDYLQVGFNLFYGYGMKLKFNMNNFKKK